MISSSRENKRAVTGLDMLAGDGSQYESDTMYKNMWNTIGSVFIN
jgi:hypothetical protein